MLAPGEWIHTVLFLHLLVARHGRTEIESPPVDLLHFIDPKTPSGSANESNHLFFFPPTATGDAPACRDVSSLTHSSRFWNKSARSESVSLPS